MRGSLSRLRRFGPAVAAGLAGVALFAFVVHWLTSGGTTQMRVVNETVQIKIVQPPPPPPKVEPPPPEPPKMVEQTPIKQEQPDKPKEAPKPAEPPPGPLGLDAKGQGPGDSFGLVGNPGGTGLLGGGGGGGSQFGAYASVLQVEIQQALHKNEKLATAQYRLLYRLWLSENGKPERVELVNSTGDAAIDALIKQTILGMPPLKPPPKDMPQPIIVATTAVRQG